MSGSAAATESPAGRDPVGSASAHVTVSGLRKVYGQTVAADIEHLEVRQGELLSLLGPSGCGKTTTLRCIAGLIQPDAGVIRIGGRDIALLPTHERNLGMVFQSYAIFPHLNVFDNIAYGLENRKLSKPEIRDRVAEALKLVGLADYERRFRHQLSGGQQQRVALARAIVYRPDVLLLDEPLSNLDAKLRKTMRVELRRLQQRLQLTTIFVTHDQQEALSMSDTVVVMNEGRIEQIGSPQDVYERPRSSFVADFIGSTNLLTGVVRSYDMAAQTAVVEIDGGSTLPIQHETAVAPGERVRVLIKPEKARLVAERRSADAVPCEVLEQAYLGAVTQYQVRVAARTIEIVQSGERGERFAPGAAAWVQFDEDWLRLIEG